MSFILNIYSFLKSLPESTMSGVSFTKNHMMKFITENYFINFGMAFIFSSLLFRILYFLEINQNFILLQFHLINFQIWKYSSKINC